MLPATRYNRCAASGCFNGNSVIVAEVALCPEHLEGLKAELMPTALTQPGSGFVYYVGWRHRPDVIKIGTTTNLRNRLKQLSTSSQPAKLLVSEPGSYYLEKKRHRQFSHLRVPNESELFRWAPQLADHVAEVRTKVGWSGKTVQAADLPTRLHRTA